MIVNDEKEREYLIGIAKQYNASFEQLWERFSKSEWKIDDFIATISEEFNEK